MISDYVSVEEIISSARKMSIKYKVSISLAECFEEWRGTCKSVDEIDPAAWFVCSECGYGRDGIVSVPRFCPNCGRKVES